MKHLLLGLTVTTLMLGSCNTNKKEKEDPIDQLYGEVMSIHDGIMPEMETIITYEEKCKIMTDSLIKLENDNYVNKIDSLTTLLDSLIIADKAMMQWMRAFHNKSTYTGMKPEEIIEYLSSEKEKILIVKQKMDSSISKAKQMFK